MFLFVKYVLEKLYSISTLHIGTDITGFAKEVSTIMLVFN